MDTNPRRCEACGSNISHLLRPTGRPRKYCEHDDCKRARRREQYRLKRKVRRGTGRRLIQFSSDRNADGESREYGIRDLPLWQEHQPDDEAGHWLDERATCWIEHAPKLKPEQRLVAALVEDRAMLREAYRRRKAAAA